MKTMKAAGTALKLLIEKDMKAPAYVQSIPTKDAGKKKYQEKIMKLSVEIENNSKIKELN